MYLPSDQKDREGAGQDPDRRFMERALELASRGVGHTSPNPAVGAVVVREGQIVGEGYHRQAGSPHAEEEALRSAGEAAQGATLYVTLEPCNHAGRTPPCTEAILEAGIGELFYAVPDPNPNVRGGGGQRLAEAGLAVHVGPCTVAARELNRAFFHYVHTGRPYVIAKFAASIDGKIATRQGDSQWITGSEARHEGHRLRHFCDGIAVGTGTVLADDPRLTTRLSDVATPSHPVRIVLDSRGRVPAAARVFDPDLPGQALVATTQAMPLAKREALARRGVAVMVLPADETGRVGVVALLEALGDRQMTSLLVEGGSQVLGSFFDAGLVDEVWAFLAPLVIGGEAAPGPVGGRGPARLAGAFEMETVEVRQVGPDICVRGRARALMDEANLELDLYREDATIGEVG